MPRTVTVTFSDDTQHVYNNVPDEVTPDAIESRAATEFQGKTLKSIDGGKFSQTGGGAAVGNPSIQRQGEKSIRPDVPQGGGLAAIGGSAAAGGVLGAIAPELLSGAATIAGGLPAPVSGLRGPLQFMSGVTRAAGRPAGAVAGTIGGAVGETAGQAVEATGAPQPYAEAARFIGGGVSNEPLVMARRLAEWYQRTPKLSFESKAKSEFLKGITEKLGIAPQSVSKQELEYLEKLASEIRGSGSEASLENVGSIMGAEGKRILNVSEYQMANALRQAGSVGNVSGSKKTLADVGEGLQQTILARNKAALDARDTQYTNTERARDAIVSQREAARQFPKDVPEYRNIVKSLEAELVPGVRSPDVAKSFQNILSSIKTKIDPVTLTNRQIMGYDPKPAPKETPATFQRIDDVRRQLGEVFRGKPPEGYEGIDAATAKKYYAMLSDLQKKYAGAEQAKLLDDYAARTEGLEVFSSKLGKKVTALDQYREGQYPDPSNIPAAFFKTRASIRALQELTGNKTQVQSAALEFANHELAGKDANGVRSWMSKNAEWLSEVPATRTLVDKYATRLESSDRAMRNASDFAKRAGKDASLLIGKALPAQNAIDFIKKGEVEFWDKVIPAFQKSPQSKRTLVEAVRKVVADQADSGATQDLFNRNIRPFLEKGGIASKTEMDFISSKLDEVSKRNIPEPERLGMIKRILLNATGSWAASAVGRTGALAADYGVNMIPEQIPGMYPARQ